MRDVSLRDATRWRWRDIFNHFKVDSRVTNGKHQACPICGGKDRFRFTNLEGRGTWYCNQCGAGDGFNLIMGVTGKTFGEVAKEIKPLVGSLPPQPYQEPDREKLEADRLEARKQLWDEAVPIRHGDQVDLYLRSRGIQLSQRLIEQGALRFHESCRYDPSSAYPAMLALVSDERGKAVQVHRTYLSPSSNGKAEVPSPRKMMPGTFPHGAAVRLYPAGEHLGIAEGIETAISAAQLMHIPVWSAIDAAHLLTWRPPPGVKRVTVFGDHDRNYVGQTSAYGLANRLVLKNKLQVDVAIPGEVDRDWNDKLMENVDGATGPTPKAQKA